MSNTDNNTLEEKQFSYKANEVVNTTDSDDNEKTMEQLRDLLFHEELSRIGNLEQQLNNLNISPETIAKVLAEAVRVRSEDNDDLANALSSTIENSVKSSVARNPQALSDALFPVMGPAIRKSINNAIESMLQSLNQTLEYGFSMQGLRWRFDAFRTKKSFAEIVLLNTLVYRVEQVFLIHKESGVLLHHCSFDNVKNEDADVVSGMLTAVQDFIKDSFSENSDQNVETLRLGNLEIIIQQSPDLVLALVNRGNAPRALYSSAVETLEGLQQQYFDALKSFNGDTSVFESTGPVLDQLMVVDYGSSGKKASLLKPILAVSFVFIAIFGWIAYDIYEENDSKARWNAYIDQLNVQPGIIIARHQVIDGIHTLTGLRDPLSVDPISLLAQHGLDDNDVSLLLQPYSAGQQDFILTRIKKLIQPPESVQLSFENSVLYLVGTAEPRWVEMAQYRAAFVDGVSSVDVSGINSLFERIKAALNPPATVTLTLTAESKVVAIGEATESWARDAAHNILQFTEVSDYNQQELVLVDSPEYLLQQAKELLTPPSEVKLSVTAEKILTAAGTAQEAWINEAHNKVKSITHLQGYDDSKLEAYKAAAVIPVDNDALILKRAIAYLVPPATTELTFAKGTLRSQGNASERWIRRALNNATKVEGVSKYDSDVKPLTDAQILAEAIKLLQPPASVTLTYKTGILSATGSATKDWINKAENEFVGVDSIHSFYTTNLTHPE
ncbi:MAG: hypothetical protein AUK35_00610 [Zetaproteobacteria bacterium CG2_30_46_52]|nr:MAG: hypothetical protein AUK35_00610 [Zetaproteobacteria bacterium CG2_30_46_52]